MISPERKCPRALLLACLIGWMVVPASAFGQNVSGYRRFPDPFLFLLREPAIHQELKLKADQLRQLTKINESFDGVLLRTRNIPVSKGQPYIVSARSKTRAELSKVFTPEQQERLAQITRRLRGDAFLQSAAARQQLKLSKEQETKISELLEQSGKDAEENKKKDRRQSIAAQVQAILDSRQRQTLKELLGSPFDVSRLGRVTFKAPDVQGDEWVNSKPLELKDLRGKVVALHFWAYG